jgi:hypothetical protein
VTKCTQAGFFRITVQIEALLSERRLFIGRTDLICTRWPRAAKLPAGDCGSASRNAIRWHSCNTTGCAVPFFSSVITTAAIPV